ncbi:aldo/keto reductase [Candidatus Latescibacterota bacterium]
MPPVESAHLSPLHRNDESMRYRDLGRTGLQVSAVSMGCMRLGEDQEVNSLVVARAIDVGMNYFETTRGYCGGHCQHRVAPGLKGRPTGIIVSGKGGMGPETTEYGFRRELETQLEILGISHFKFYQVGWFSWGEMPHLLRRGGALDALRRAQNEGLVHHIGFTGHDTPENFIKCIETGLFDTLTIPYNLFQRDYEPTIARAGELGVGVVAMGPVAGGLLGDGCEALEKELGLEVPMVEAALGFVLANPHVSTACSGMSTVEMVDQNATIARRLDLAAGLDFGSIIARLDQIRGQLEGGLCTTCGYCQPCPQGVRVPRYMGEYLNWKGFGLQNWARSSLLRVPSDQSMDLCNECGECEEKCPVSLPIRARLGELRTLLDA